MSKLAGKVALVTGGARGIGRAIAERLGGEGASVAVNYRAAVDKAAEVVETIRKSGGKAFAIEGDVARAADVQRLFELTISEFGGLDILVNNAGLFLMKSILETTLEDWRKLHAVRHGQVWSRGQRNHHLWSGSTTLRHYHHWRRSRLASLRGHLLRCALSAARR